MAASLATPGLGTLLEIDVSANSTPDWQAVGEITNISGPNMAKDEYDVTHLQSPNGWEEVKMGIKRGGEMTLTCNWVRADFILWLARFNAAPGVDLYSFRLSLPDLDDSIIHLDAFVKGIPMEIPTTSQIINTITLRTSGPITIES